MYYLLLEINVDSLPRVGDTNFVTKEPKIWGVKSSKTSQKRVYCILKQ